MLEKPVEPSCYRHRQTRLHDTSVSSLKELSDPRDISKIEIFAVKQVWAAGFSAALLKKRSSATLPSVESIEGYELGTNKGIPKVQNTEPTQVETILLSVLEKFFYFIFKLPDVNRRLTKIITTLTKNQPSCPQLYLYSTADKVVPSCQVDMFIHGQKVLGREVWARNFGSSPHVDHYRTFPDEYSAELNRFLEHISALVHSKISNV